MKELALSLCAINNVILAIVLILQSRRLDKLTKDLLELYEHFVVHKLEFIKHISRGKNEK